MAVFACSPGSLQFGSRTLNLLIPDRGGGASSTPVATTASEKFGRGPVPVALLLPLTGDDPAIAQVRVSMANASKLAIAFIDANANIGETITISLRDTGTTSA